MEETRCSNGVTTAEKMPSEDVLNYVKVDMLGYKGLLNTYFLEPALETSMQEIESECKGEVNESENISRPKAEL